MTAKRFSQLRDDLYERSPESRQRVAEKVEALSEELALSELRGRTQRTQAQIAEAIGTSQSGVSRIERQRDFLISTLRDYVAATGGQLHLVARYPDFDCELRLPVLDESATQVQPPRAFRVVWQNVRTRQLVQVGWLEFSGREFAFAYTPDADLDPDFEPFAAFPDLRTTYRSTNLFSFFADRVVSAARPDFEHLITALGLTRAEATPVELLARSWGMTPHDTIQVVPEPVVDETGAETRPFLVSGIRHVDERHPDKVAEFVARLTKGQILSLQDEPDNPINPRAIVLDASGQRVGWVPDYLLDYLHKYREAGNAVSAVVEHSNGPEAPWHLRLLCQLVVGRPHER
ncbi:MAG: helix-turn-helix domain-containing protein [Acidimicrobiales bacterium]